MYYFPITGSRGDGGMGSHPELPTSEYLEGAMRQARQERLEESRFVDPGLRQWWLDELGCLEEGPAPEPWPSPIDRLLVNVGGLLVAIGNWLRRRSALGAGQPT